MSVVTKMGGENSVPPRAYSYRRISDHSSQSDGDGLRRQQDFAQTLAAKHGWILDDTLRFTDSGRSAFHGKNLDATADLARFLSFVESGRISAGSILIIENIDRLSRQDVDVAYDLFRGLIRSGILIATQTPDRIYRRENNSLMDLMEPIWLMYLAHQESLKKSQRIGSQWEQKRVRARSSLTPHGKAVPGWLQLTSEGYKPILRAVKTIQIIFRLCIEGNGISKIAHWLNEHSLEHPPFGDRKTDKKHQCGPRSRGPKQWNPSYVRYILRGKHVLGFYQPHVGHSRQEAGEPIPGYYPVVVTEELWSLAQASLSGRKSKSGRPGNRVANLFTGLVYEARTRARMSINSISSGDKPETARRYLLANNNVVRSCRRGNGMSYDQFEAGILERIGQFSLRDVLPHSAKEHEREAKIGALTARLVVIDHRTKEIQEQIENFDDPAVVGILAQSLSKLLSERKLVIEELRSAKIDSSTGRGENLSEVQSIIDLLSSVQGTPEEISIRSKLKGCIPWLIEEIWLLVQPIGSRKFVGHAQIYLRNGQRRYVQLLPFNPRHLSGIWDLSDCDFRAGDIGDVAPDFVIEPELVR